MHTSMQKLVNAQEEMRAQIEVLQRAMRNHFIHNSTNFNSNNSALSYDYSPQSNANNIQTITMTGGYQHSFSSPRYQNQLCKHFYVIYA